MVNKIRNISHVKWYSIHPNNTSFGLHLISDWLIGNSLFLFGLQRIGNGRAGDIGMGLEVCFEGSVVGILNPM